MIGNQEEVSVFRVKIIRAYKEALFYLASSRLIIVVKTDCSKENQCIWDRQSGEIIYGYSQTFWASQGSTSGKEPTSQCRREKRYGFNPWVGKIPRRAWQPAPVFLSGEIYGQRSLVGYSPWGRKESDTTEAT